MALHPCARTGCNNTTANEKYCSTACFQLEQTRRREAAQTAALLRNTAKIKQVTATVETETGTENIQEPNTGPIPTMISHADPTQRITQPLHPNMLTQHFGSTQSQGQGPLPAVSHRPTALQPTVTTATDATPLQSRMLDPIEGNVMELMAQDVRHLSEFTEDSKAIEDRVWTKIVSALCIIAPLAVAGLVGSEVGWLFSGGVAWSTAHAQDLIVQYILGFLAEAMLAGLTYCLSWALQQKIFKRSTDGKTNTLLWTFGILWTVFTLGSAVAQLGYFYAQQAGGNIQDIDFAKVPLFIQVAIWSRVTMLSAVDLACAAFLARKQKTLPSFLQSQEAKREGVERISQSYLDLRRTFDRVHEDQEAALAARQRRNEMNATLVSLERLLGNAVKSMVQDSVDGVQNQTKRPRRD